MSRSLLETTLAGAFLAGVAVTAGMATPVKADVELSARGPVAYLSSEHLDQGDPEQVEAFLNEPRRQRIRIIYLNSRGGNTEAAIRIGQIIRQHGIDTGFHVGRGRCVSACTTMFLGGVNRYYIGSRGVSDGIATRRGLGFHPASNRGGGGNGMAEERIAEYYRQMGVPGAASLRYHVYPRGGGGGREMSEGYGPEGGYGGDPYGYGGGGGYGPYGGGGYDGPYGGGGYGGGGYGGGKKQLFFAGGRSALRAGVATSTSEPRDPALRD